MSPVEKARNVPVPYWDNTKKCHTGITPKIPNWETGITPKHAVHCTACLGVIPVIQCTGILNTQEYLCGNGLQLKLAYQGMPHCLKIPSINKQTYATCVSVCFCLAKNRERPHFNSFLQFVDAPNFHVWHTIEHNVEHPVPCEPWFRNLSGSEFE